jgi:hypothetical protein
MTILRKHYRGKFKSAMTPSRREQPFRIVMLCVLDFPTTRQVPASNSRVRGTLNVVGNGCALRDRR